MARKRSVVRWILAGVGLLVAAVVVFAAVSIFFFRYGRSADVAVQRRRVAGLEQTAPAPANLAQDLAVPDATPLERLRVIATHNSYHRQSDGLRLFFIGLIEPSVPATLRYTHAALSTQLDAGIRSFELDVRLRKGSFEITHVPLVDDRTDEPDFALALREIALWSKRNPGHVPVSILIEIKDDYMFLDQGLRKIGGPELLKLDEVIRAELGSQLLVPDAVRGAAPSLASAIERAGWPTVGSLRGTVLVILHQDEKYRQPYVADAPALQGRAMFTCAPEGAPDAGVAIANDPVKDGARIAALVSRHWLVRTRADGDGEHSAAGLAAALQSGAQVVSTDNPPAYPASDGYAAAFAGGRMLEVRAGR